MLKLQFIGSTDKFNGQTLKRAKMYESYCKISKITYFSTKVQKIITSLTAKSKMFYGEIHKNVHFKLSLNSRNVSSNS